MFQILDFKPIAAGEKVVIDEQLKSQYKGITGLTIWTPKNEQMRNIDIELDIDNKEVFPAGFPAEIFSSNQFRDTDASMFKQEFPANSKIEGSIKNNNDTSVTGLSIIFFVKL